MDRVNKKVFKIRRSYEQMAGDLNWALKWGLGIF